MFFPSGFIYQGASIVAMARYLSFSISQNAVDRATIVAAGWLLFAGNGVTVFDDVSFSYGRKRR
jgi:hypothetical protein